jgi:hypothetical protein
MLIWRHRMGLFLDIWVKAIITKNKKMVSGQELEMRY